MVELGKVDIYLEILMISSHLALLREDRLNPICRMFSYLKKHHNTELVIDPSDPAVDASEFERRHWTSIQFGYILQEGVELMSRMTQPRGVGFVTRATFDAEHTSNTVTRRSRTGFIV